MRYDEKDFIFSIKTPGVGRIFLSIAIAAALAIALSMGALALAESDWSLTPSEKYSVLHQFKGIKGYITTKEARIYTVASSALTISVTTAFFGAIFYYWIRRREYNRVMRDFCQRIDNNERPGTR